MNSHICRAVMGPPHQQRGFVSRILGDKLESMDVLINSKGEVLSQSMHISNYHTVPLKYLTSFCHLYWVSKAGEKTLAFRILHKTILSPYSSFMGKSL